MRSLIHDFILVCIFGNFATNLLGCQSSDPSARQSELSSARESAITASSEQRGFPDVTRPSDVGVPPGTIMRHILRPLAVSASQHPGHFRNKLSIKPAAETSATLLPAPSVEYLAKQAEYAARLKILEPTLVGMPENEQATRRADLKATVLGD